MRVIGYVRVSTNGQVEGMSLQDQEASIRRYARRNKHRVIEVITDAAMSGTKDETERPGLDRALQAIRRGEADAILILNLSRLARSLHVQEATLATIWKWGGKVYETETGREVLADDPDDPMRTAMRQMAGVFAQLDKSMIVKRLRNGRETRKDQGGHSVGRVPFGYQTVQEGNLKRLVPNPDTYPIVQKIVRLSDTHSLRETVKELEAQGVKPPKNAAKWSPMHIKRILDRETGDNA